MGGGGGDDGWEMEAGMDYLEEGRGFGVGVWKQAGRGEEAASPT